MEVSAYVKRDAKPRQHLLAILLSTAVVALSSCGLDKLGTKPWTEYLDAARAEVKGGDMVKAEDDFQKASKGAEAKFGHFSNQVATCTFELADMYKNMQEYRKAKIVLQDLNEIYEKLGPNSAEAEQAKKDLIFVKKKIKKYHLEPVDDAAKDKDKDGKDKDSKDKDSKDKDSKDKDKESAKDQDKKSEPKTGQEKDSVKPTAGKEKDAPPAEKGK